MIKKTGDDTQMVDQETHLDHALSRFRRAMDSLEKAIEYRLNMQDTTNDAEEEVQRLNADRSRLAQELDNSESRSERLEQANKEVSRRLITAMETIRTVIDR